jgi:hypothetical protein
MKDLAKDGFQPIFGWHLALHLVEEHAQVLLRIFLRFGLVVREDKSGEAHERGRLEHSPRGRVPIAHV